MFRADYRTKELDDYFRSTFGIDTKILAVEIGMSSNHIEAYQRQLGLRKVADNNPRAKKNRYATDHRGRPRKGRSKAD